jgi:hypothetical protein
LGMEFHSQELYAPISPLLTVANDVLPE